MSDDVTPNAYLLLTKGFDADALRMTRAAPMGSSCKSAASSSRTFTGSHGLLDERRKRVRAQCPEGAPNP